MRHIKETCYRKLFYNRFLNEILYLEFFQNHIDEEINSLPLNILINLIWQQDGAPTHSILAVSEYLNASYNTWIGRNGTILLIS